MELMYELVHPNPVSHGSRYVAPICHEPEVELLDDVNVEDDDPCVEWPNCSLCIESVEGEERGSDIVRVRERPCALMYAIVARLASDAKETSTGDNVDALDIRYCTRGLHAGSRGNESNSSLCSIWVTVRIDGLASGLGLQHSKPRWSRYLITISSSPD